MLSLHASHAAPASVDTPLLAVFCTAATNGAPLSLPPALASVDAALHGALSRTLARRDFRGGRDETFVIAGGERGVERVVLVGLGKGPASRAQWRRAGSVAARAAARLGCGALHAWAQEATPEQIEGLVAGLGLGAWTYPDLRTPAPATERRDPVASATVLLADDDASRAAFAFGEALAAGYSVARRLGMMPGNVDRKSVV